LKNLSRRLTHLLTGDIGQVVVFIVRFMVSPHHKDNLEPLGSQGTQRLVMAMAVIPLAPVVELGPLTVVERDKGKPVHRVAQMLVTGKTKVYKHDFCHWLWSPVPLPPRREDDERTPSDPGHRRVRPRPPPPGFRFYRPAASWQTERPG